MWQTQPPSGSSMMMVTQYFLTMKTKKKLQNPKTLELSGGDKRDRTADLLNAMAPMLNTT